MVAISACLALCIAAAACSPPVPDPLPLETEGSNNTRTPSRNDGSAGSDEDLTPGGSPDAGPVGDPADQCVVSATAQQQDRDPEDSAETPFARPPGKKLLVHFVNAGAPDRYWKLLGSAAAIWSTSPCVQAVLVESCPAGANCVRLRAEPTSDDEDTDGEFSGDEQGGVRVGGTLTVFTDLMDESSDNGALATIVHELGHAFGLVHRLDEDDVMNAWTDDDTHPVPDRVDFDNLLVIYGTKQ